jgi:hypothetical protein
MRELKAFVYLVATALWITAGGCSGGGGDRPDMGAVSGVVTLDGQPLPSASVSFTQPGFRPSIGMTDASGHYELIYLRDIKGAALGQHLVKIKLLPQEGQRIKQLPSQYNSNSDITREVKSGENVFDFELKSKA